MHRVSIAVGILIFSTPPIRKFDPAMSSNHINLVAILLETLLISCFLLAGVASARSKTKSQGTSELTRNPNLSSPEECARTCHAGEPPKTCYYHFTLESYTVLGNACDVCTPNKTNSLREDCQCVLADGVERVLLTVNRMLPGPSIEVCKGDKVVIDVENKMDGMEVTIHWHGILQKGSPYYDGVPMVTQCPIHHGETFRYQWMAEDVGTHFWHSHSGLQKMDGLYGVIIIREPIWNDPSAHLYDEDLSSHVMMISDWMHQQATERFPGLLRTMRGQNPDSALINGKGRYTNPKTGCTTNTPLEVFTVKPGRRYRFRMINAFCSVCPAQLNIQGHGLTLIAADGDSVRPVEINTIVSFAGERFDFIINADQTPGDYWIQLRAIGECGVGRVQQLGVLRYEGERRKKLFMPPTYDKGLPIGVVLNPLDAICDAPRNDAICINQLKHAQPIDKEILEPHPDVKIFLPFHLNEYTPRELFEPHTYNHYLVAPDRTLTAIFIDGISFEFPSAPTLSQSNDLSPEEFCNGDNRPPNCGQFCSCTHRINIPLNAIVELVVIDEMGVANLSHPFHLHGYAFNVIGMGRSPDTNVKKITLKHVRDLDRRGLLKRNWDLVPFKDTVAVPNNGYVILRFRADNPGEWLFHCHFIYHIGIGMDVILNVGTKQDLPPVPPGFPRCGNYLPPIRSSDTDESAVCRSEFGSQGAQKPKPCQRVAS